jgi:hypothetical protein
MGQLATALLSPSAHAGRLSVLTPMAVLSGSRKEEPWCCVDVLPARADRDALGMLVDGQQMIVGLRADVLGRTARSLRRYGGPCSQRRRRWSA